MTLEKRGFEIRVQAAGRRLTGIAAPFNQETRIGHYIEVIRPGAFAASLPGRDILALVDHDTGRVLARTKSGTLQLREATDGLHFDLTLPDTQAARDVLALAERGDMGGASIGFTVPDGGERWDGNKRELRGLTLHEISLVSAWPAYQGTSIQARQRQHMTLNDYRLRVLGMNA